MTDIPELIERLRKFAASGLCDEAGRAAYAECQDAMEQAAEALSHLTASPLPDEIAGYVTWLQELAAKGGKSGVDIPNVDARALGRIAAALERMARHNTALEAALNARTEELYPDLQRRIAKLEEAANAPLPDEIAGLVKHLRSLMKDPGVDVVLSPVFAEAATALERLARTNKWGSQLLTARRSWIEKAEARISELEAALADVLPLIVNPGDGGPFEPGEVPALDKAQALLDGRTWDEMPER